jgi:hypothetical protein
MTMPFAAMHESVGGTFRTLLLELMMSVHWVKANIGGCERRDLILTRSAYDHERVRPLKPGAGVVKSLGAFPCGPVVLVRTQKFQL